MYDTKTLRVRSGGRWVATAGCAATGAVDLSAYATTAYVDGELAKVYDKAAVDTAIAAAIAGLAAPDLTGYATVSQVELLLADPANHPATDLSDYYTKSEVDQKFVDAATGVTVDLSNYAPLASNLDFIAENVTGKTTVSARYFSLLNTIDNSESGCEICVLQKSTGSSDYDLTMKVGNQHHIIAFRDDVADLSGYATTEQLETTKTEILTQATVAFQERYTKQEVDGLFVKKEDMVAPPGLDGYATEQYVDDSIARIPAVDAYTKAEVDAKVNVLALDIQAVNDQTAAHFQLFSDGLQPTFDAKADKADTYTKAEVDAKIPATSGSVDLSAYAKLNDTAQAITAKSATAETFTGVAFQFIKENAPSTAFALADVDGQERPVYAVGSKKFPLAFTTETTGSGSVDLSAYAKKEDADQALLAKTITAQAIGFGDRLLPAVALGYADTGEGYGPRFVVNVGPTNEYLVYKSDLEPFAALLPRIESLEGKSAAGVPTAQSINDPALADFKASVLDEVKKLMAGGKTVPADVGWAKLLNAGTAVNAPEAKVLNGVVYMRGEAVKQGGAGYTANAYQLPPSIPAPPREMVVPLAMKNTSPSGRYYGYATIQTNRQIGVSSDNAFNTVWFDGISYPAYE